MKYLSLLFLLVLSKFTTGQNVFTKFEKVVMYDDFSYVSNRWEQKNSSSESFIISNNVYTVKRVKDTYFAITLPNETDEYANFELVTSIKMESTVDGKLSSGGLVLKAQKSGDGAIILEINNQKAYRLLIMVNGKIQPLFGNKDLGWHKSRNLNESTFNEIKIVTFGNEFDIYFNKKFERTFIETTFDVGRIGYYVGAKSGISCDYLILRANESESPDDASVSSSNGDETYTELALVFKTKIDKQRMEIDKLSEELNICRSSLSMDTSAIGENKVLNKENRELNRKVVQLEAEVEQSRERLSYLESMKEDIENDTNGDVILNLTELLSKQKSKNEDLKKENEKLKKDLQESQQRY
jgi:hypothetical protein